MFHQLKVLLCFAFISLFILGCGQKGALYLPENQANKAEQFNDDDSAQEPE
jgi:predicted small lipoprotein YifL